MPEPEYRALHAENQVWPLQSENKAVGVGVGRALDAMILRDDVDPRHPGAAVRLLRQAAAGGAGLHGHVCARAL
jgi:hypothetical protein